MIKSIYCKGRVLIFPGNHGFYHINYGLVKFFPPFQWGPKMTKNTSRLASSWWIGTPLRHPKWTSTSWEPARISQGTGDIVFLHLGMMMCLFNELSTNTAIVGVCGDSQPEWRDEKSIWHDMMNLDDMLAQQQNPFLGWCPIFRPSRISQEIWATVNELSKRYGRNEPLKCQQKSRLPLVILGVFLHFT